MAYHQTAITSDHLLTWVDLSSKAIDNFCDSAFASSLTVARSFVIVAKPVSSRAFSLDADAYSSHNVVRGIGKKLDQ